MKEAVINIRERNVFGPVVIKELRQELRLRSFIFLFLVPQLAMGISILFGLSDQDNATFTSAVFWPAIAIPLLILIPRRGFATFSKEIEANSLELVLLTRLTAWRLVVGKWIALAAQSLLFLFAMSPYIVLRYFLGDTNPVQTATIIGVLTLTSLVLTAMGISGSAAGRKKRGSAFLLILFFILGGPLISLISTFGYMRGSSSVLSGEELLVLLTMGSLGILLLLEIAVTRIAPPLENYALRKRALGMLVVLVAALFFYIAPRADALTIIALVFILVPTCISSLFEKPHPFLLFRLKGRGNLKDWLAYPGWPGGIIFMGLACLCILGLLSLKHMIEPPMAPILFLEIMGGLLLPFAVLSIFAPTSRSRQNFATYLIIQLFGMLFSYLLIIPSNTAASQLLTFFPLTMAFIDLISGLPSKLKIISHSGTMLVSASVLFVLLLKFLNMTKSARHLEPSLEKP